MPVVRVAVTGATGLIGSKAVESILNRGHAVVALSRNPENAREKLRAEVEVFKWDPSTEGAPTLALAGADAVLNLAGEPIDQRWSGEVKRRVLDSRVSGTRNLVESIGAVDPMPRTFVSASAVGYYGPHDDETVDEESPPGNDFLAHLCSGWEHEALRAEGLGLRVVLIRTGLVLSGDGGALAKMLPLFKLGAGGSIGRGRHYMPWIHIDDEVGLIVSALENASYEGPINATSPSPVSNKEFAGALGRVLHRPTLLPVPTQLLRLVLGEMSEIATTGVNARPKRALKLGYEFIWDSLEPALHDLVG